MRVVHLTSSFPRHAGDANGPYIAELVAAQRAAGIEAMVVAPHAPGLPVEDELFGVPVRRFRYAPPRAEVLAYRGGLLSTARRPAGALAVGPFLAAFSRAARRAVRTWEADLVHAHWWLPAGWAAVRGARSTGTPTVVTCHGSDVGLARRTGFSGPARSVLIRATLVAAVSDALAAELRDVVPGVDPTVLRMPFRGWDEPRVAPPEDAPLRLVAVGRLMPEKGFDLLVAATAALVAEGRAVRVTIVGDGPLRGVLAAQVGHSGLEEVVTFAGPVSRDGLRRAIDAAHAVVVPSRREGLGLVALDAIDRGRPVIASAVGGLPETLLAGGEVPAGNVHPSPEGLDTPAGILVRPGDVAALTHALGRLPRAGRVVDPSRLRDRHDPDRIASEHLDAYRRAARLG
ncbi:MAG TPA: glycosyltransferase [Acidimicrobiales bacterium]|nr:glycosyltransferase [Acidimicrobiales bacterium]